MLARLRPVVYNRPGEISAGSALGVLQSTSNS